MTWLFGFSKRSHNNNHHDDDGVSDIRNLRHRKPQILGILAFEAARTMSRLVSLYKSLSENQIQNLCTQVMRSEGVAYLTSMDEGFLFKLACAERIEDLDRSAIAVARFGKKCSDPGLSRFEFAYADLKLGFIDLAKVDYASKGIEKSIQKMEKFISATSSLYAELESLSEMEALERKTKRWKDHSGPIQMQKPRNDFSEQNHQLQKQQVQRLKEISLWNQPFDRIVGFMARTVCIVYSRICVVFGPHVSVLQTQSSRHVRFSSLQIQFTPQEPVKERSKSGPIGIGANLGFHFGIGAQTTRLVEQAPSTTIGGSGLALRYASLIVSLEKYLDSPRELTDSGREELYQMLPESLKSAVNMKLKKLYRNQNVLELGWWEDEGLAEGWRDGLEVIMGWLAPVAHDTVKWTNERSFEKYSFDAKPTVLLLQTLYFADKEKTEATMVEVLVGLSFICRFEFNRLHDQEDEKDVKAKAM